MTDLLNDDGDKSYPPLRRDLLIDLSIRIDGKRAVATGAAMDLSERL